MMKNYYSYSLEQELALRMVSIQIQKTTDVNKLQDELIEPIKQILIKQQKFKDIFHCPRKEREQGLLHENDWTATIT